MPADRPALKWVVPLLVLSLLLVSFLTYQYIVPRTVLEVRTVYHESPGGGGTGGAMNVYVLLTNRGNREIGGLQCSVHVISGDGTELTRSAMDGETLASRENTEMRLSFIGSHYSEYRMIVRLRFESTGNTVAEELVHTTTEDSMNLVFVDRVG